MISICSTLGNPSDEASNHLSNLTDGRWGFVSPLESLRNWQRSNHVPQMWNQLVQDIVNDFETFITGEKVVLDQLVDKYGPINDGTFSEELIRRLRYENFRTTSKGRLFFEQLNIKACPYCNGNFIVHLDSSGKLLCHFDHIYPKSKYPYLSISFFNLVPVCGNCNLLKSSRDPYNNSSFHHPFTESLAQKFKFKATHEAITKLALNGRTIRGGNNIVIESENNIDFHISTFHLKNLYDQHSDFIDEAFLKSKIYNESYLEELKEIYVDNLKIFESGEELTRIIYGNYMEEHNIIKRPLSKFAQDLKEQFHYLSFD